MMSQKLWQMNAALLSLVVVYKAAAEDSPATYTDRIAEIEVNPYEITIITTKVGPLSTLRIKIDLVDLRDNRNVTVYNLPGPILQFNRGKYSLIVAPDHWYGIIFRSENVYEANRYQNIEKRLVRTPPEGQSLPRPGVKVNFWKDDDHIENVILQAKWVDKETRRALTMVGVTVEITCERTSSVQTFSLSKSDLVATRSFQVRTINEFHIKQTSSGTVAKVSAKSCKRICWEQTLVANRFDEQFVSYHESRICEPLAPINSSSPIRTYQDYQVENGTLTILTNYQAPKGKDNFEKAEVQINATLIGDPQLLFINDSDTLPGNTSFELNRYVKYNTNESDDGEFILEQLEPGQWYTVVYQYTLLSPFRFHEQKRLIVYSNEPGLNNQKRVPKNAPVKLIFTPIAHYEHNEHLGEGRLPSVRLEQNPNYKGYSIMVSVPPPCEAVENITSNSNSATEVWLDDSNPAVNLNIDLVTVLCKQSTKYKFCDSKHHIGQSALNCNRRICFNGFVLIDGERYEMKEYCEDLLHYFPEPKSNTNSLYRKISTLWWFSELMIYLLLSVSIA